MAIERKVAVRVEFGTGADNLGSALSRYKSQVEDLSRVTSAWQRQMEKVPNLPVGPWLKAQEAIKEQAFRTPFGLGPRGNDDARLFQQFQDFARPSVDPLMEKLKPRMQMGALATSPPPLAGVFLEQKKAADSFRQSIDELERSLDKQLKTVGMSANAARIWEMKQEAARRGVSPERIKAVEALQVEADLAIEKEIHRKTKEFWSPKRIFAGGGFAMLGLAAQGAGGGILGQAISGASTGAGVAVALGANTPMGMMVGAAAGAATSMFATIKEGIESVFPSISQFNGRMRELGQSLEASDEVLSRMRRGESPGAAEIDVLSGATIARVRSAGVLGEPGTEEARLAVLRRDRERLAASSGELPFSPITWTERDRETWETASVAIRRAREAGLASMDAIIARGGAEGLTRPTVPMARGSGGVESIGIEMTRAILERSGPMERTAEAASGIHDIIRAAAAAWHAAGSVPSPP